MTVRFIGTRLIFLLGFFTASSGWAGGLCDYYKAHSAFLYDAVCKKGESATKPAGANSTFSDGFNINSAALPTEPSSYGIEMIGSRLRTPQDVWSPTFSVIKGFHRFGAGISTSGNSTFYGNDIVQRATLAPNVDSFKPRERARGHLTNLNAGTSVALLKMKEGPSVQLGYSLRYNKITNSWGGGPGLLVSWGSFTFGGGYTREKISNYFGSVEFTNYLVSTRLSIFEFEYTMLKNYGGFSLSPIHIFTVSANIRRLVLTGAIRRSTYTQYGWVTQHYFAAQYLFSKSIAVGYLYNYIPGANSIGLQYYL